MKLSKAYKAEHYDEIAQDKDKYMLALFDLANDKFSTAIRIKESEYFPGEKGSVSMRLSWRGMPLFLVEWTTPENTHKSTHVYTESELETISRNSSGRDFSAILRDLFYQCKRDLYPKAA